MNLAGKIACKTAGAAGMGIALYDAMCRGKSTSRKTAEYQEAKYLEKAYFNARTVDEANFSSNKIRKETFDLKTKNPIPRFYGKVKGFFKGMFTSLGNNLPIVAFSALALTAKNTWAKVGVSGIALTLIYNIARNGFGANKRTPMD